MGECRLCGKNGDDVSLLVVRHKQLGHIEVCRDCWEKLWDENAMVSGTGSGGGCPSCG